MDVYTEIKCDYSCLYWMQGYILLLPSKNTHSMGTTIPLEMAVPAAQHAITK